MVWYAYNSVQYNRIEHVNVYRFFTNEKFYGNIVELPKIRLDYQLADILTKAILNRVFLNLLDKLRMLDIYTPIWMDCWISYYKFEKLSLFVINRRHYCQIIMNLKDLITIYTYTPNINIYKKWMIIYDFIVEEKPFF